MGFFKKLLGIGTAAAGVVTGNPTLIGSGLGFLGQESANQTNIDIANNANSTSIDLANTAYQRRVKDLAAAGLNPMLAYTQGGAQVPNMVTARVENSAKAASEGGLNASQAALLRAQVDNQQSQTALNAASTAKTNLESQHQGIINTEAQSRLLNLPASVHTEGKELDARAATAITKQLRESNDWNAIHYLNELANKHGYRNMTEATSSVSFRRELLDLYQQGLGSSEKEAYSNMYKTDFGKHVAPYVNSAKDASGIAGNVLGAGAALKYLKKGK